MKSSLLSLLILAMQLGCQKPEPARTDLRALQPVAGKYYRGDGLGYNIDLDMRADGTYDAQWRGCLGEYGTARGSWTVDGEHVVLSPTKEAGMMEGHLKQLDLARHDGRVILLPSDDHEFYDQHGASNYSCFQRTETLK